MSRNTGGGPDFIVFGAQKSGTTSLYRYLVEHPRVAPAAAKQVDFFSHEKFHRGTGWYLSQFPADREEGEISGEASPYYMFHPHAPRRVRDFDPHIKLIAILRNPVDRTYSHYQHQVRNWREHLSFEEALEKEEERIGADAERMLRDETYYGEAHRWFSYLARSRYAEQLERWFSLFPREQVLILCSEDLFADPRPVLKTATSFLGLPPPEASPGSYARHMAGSYWKGMDPGTRKMLVEHFRPHNRWLYGLLGREFPWDA
jgi:hypothetical protein